MLTGGSEMTDTVHGDPPAVDPDNIPETLCVGRFSIFLNGPLGTLTFTHVRPQAGPMIDHETNKFESVVRARIVTTVDNLMALRDLLNTTLQTQEQVTPVGTGGSAKRH